MFITFWFIQYRSKGTDDVIGLQPDHLVLIFQPITFLRLLSATELQPSNLTIFHDDLTRWEEGQELTLLLLSQLHLMDRRNTRSEFSGYKPDDPVSQSDGSRPHQYLLRNSPDVGESLPEAHKDSFGSTAKSWGGTVKGSVTCTQNYHHSPDLRQRGETLTHTWGNTPEGIHQRKPEDMVMKDCLIWCLDQVRSIKTRLRIQR